MNKCPDCLANYSDGVKHVCPPWLKMLVSNKGNNFIKDEVGNWKQRSASGGSLFVNKKIGKEIFIDFSNEARIKSIGSGYWDKAIKLKKKHKLSTIIRKLCLKKV